VTLFLYGECVDCGCSYSFQRLYLKDMTHTCVTLEKDCVIKTQYYYCYFYQLSYCSVWFAQTVYVNENWLCKVNALWLLDLEEFNEWMNEEDYLVEDDEVSCLALLLIMVNYYCWSFVAYISLLGIRKSIRPVKIEWWGVDVVSGWSGVQIVCMWSSSCHCHPHHLLPHLNPDWFYRSGTGLPRLS